MKNTYNVILLLLLLIETSYSQSFTGLQIAATTENDFLGFDNKDENYTGGLNIVGVFPEIKIWQPFFELKESSNLQLLSFGGTGYTPQDLTSVSPVVGDRPYASLVYFSLGRISLSNDQKTQIISRFYFGKVGGDAIGKAQSSLHKSNFAGSTRPVPLGWNNQIGYDGAFVVNYNVSFKKKFLKKAENRNKKYTFLKPYLTSGIDFGNYMINLQGGGYIDLLNINSYPSWSGDYSNIQIKKNEETSNAKEGKLIRLNLFINPFVRLVGYNTTLEGLMFNDNSVYKIQHKDVNRVLFEFNAGINILLFDTVYLKYTNSFRTREFRGGKSVHYWGGIALGISTLKGMTTSNKF